MLEIVTEPKTRPILTHTHLRLTVRMESVTLRFSIKFPIYIPRNNKLIPKR